MTDLIIPKTGPRITPLLPQQVNADVRAEYEKTVVTWGIPNNLIRTMARSPQLALTEVDYANSFIFDDGPYLMWPRPGSTTPTGNVLFQAAGFIEPVAKELVINLVSLVNRSRYSITHHTVIAWNRINAALSDSAPEERASRTKAMLLHLVDSTGKPDFENQTFGKEPLYDEFRLGALRFALKMRQRSHSITDDDIHELRRLCRPRAVSQISRGPLAAQFGSAGPDEAFVEAYIDGMFVELSWLVAHFGGLLNHWFTVLRVRDEDDAVRDGIDFVKVYNSVVPDDIKVRNNNLLGADGWGG